MTPALTLQSGEVELHKQPRLPVGVPRADPHDDVVAVADVGGATDGDALHAGALGPRLGPAAAVVDGDGDGEAVVEPRDGDVGAVFRAELHGHHLGGDGVVCHVVEGERVGLHLVRRRRKGGRKFL